MNKKDAIVKINKIGKISGIIVTIIKVFVIVALVLMIVGSVVLGCLPKNFVKVSFGESISATVDMNTFKYEITDEALESLKKETEEGSLTVETGILGKTDIILKVDSVDHNVLCLSGESNENKTIYIHDTVYVLLFIDITLVCTLISVIFAGKLCKAFKNCESPFEDSVIVNMKKFAYSLIPWVLLSGVSESLVSSLLTGKADGVFGLDLSMIAIVLVILFLSYVFRYGAVLQQESDETL